MTHQYLLDIIILFLTVYPLSWNYLYFFPVEKFSTYWLEIFIHEFININ